MLFPGCDAHRKRPRRGAHSGAGRMRFIRCRGSGGCRQSPSAGRRRRGCSRSSCRRGTVGSSKRNSTRKLTFLGAVSWWARVDYASRAEKEPGSRLPAAASCLGRHAHPAGRSPNSSSLFLPLAAVVAVAQGLFSPPDYSAGRCCSNPPLQPLFKADKTETPTS